MTGKTIKTRFGTLQVTPDNYLTCVAPILGFEDLTQFVLVDVKKHRPLVWLQSVEEPELAFLLSDPCLFEFSYQKETLLSQHQRDGEHIQLFSMVIFALDGTRPHKYGPIWIDTAERVFGQWVVDASVVNEHQSSVPTGIIQPGHGASLPCLAV